MAPELRARKSKDSVISAAKPKPASKVKATTPASKRKAVEDASPVVSKKSKATKEDGRSKTSKSSRSATMDEKAQRDAKSDDEFSGVSDDEKDEAYALAKVIDSGDEEDVAVDTADAFQEGQDVGKVPDVSEQLSKPKDGKAGIIYVGRIPHGFYEHEMRSYFSQFGEITRLRMSRNKHGESKHFAFIEFSEAAVAEIVAKTMDNYLLFNHILKVKLIPNSRIHENLWKGANRRFKKIPWNKMAGGRLKKPLSESAWTEKILKEERRRSERAKQLLDIGYEFDGPKLKVVDDVSREPATLEGADESVPKAIEPATPAAPAESQTVEAEIETEIEPADKVVDVKKPSKVNKQSALGSSKKAKKPKTKKASVQA
ncbi:hypothetical protein F5X99DRAFT_364607 [Biscogniauxia marginata]|nr:hypothetical protein F5X99DRAFT_364607 [Biscogniauxia marginata]